MLIDEEKDDFGSPSAEDTLNDLKKPDGKDDDSEADKSEDDEDESDDSTEDDSGDEDDSDDQDDEEKEAKNGDDSDDESDKDSDEDDADDDEKSSDTDSKVRKGDTVPLSQFIKRGKKLRELKNTIAELQKGQTDDSKKGKENMSASLKKLAERFDANPEFVEEFAKLIKGNIGIPTEVARGLQFLTENAETENQRRQATVSWRSDILPLAKQEFPNASSKQLRQLEEKFVEVALDPEHFGVKDLRVLYRGMDSFRELPGNKKKKSGETSSGKSARVVANAGKKDLSDPEAPKKWDLSPAEHDTWTNNMIEGQASSGTKVIRRKDNIL